MQKLKVSGYVLPVRIDPGGVHWANSFRLDLPAGAQLLTTDAVGPACILYALVDPTAEHEQRDFLLVDSTSNHEIDGCDYLAYVGTFATQNRARVFHLFERVSGTVQVATVGMKAH